jgi:uroporphyrin-3 C-methyltransferase
MVMSENEMEQEKITPKSRPFFWGNIGILFSGLATAVLIISMGLASYGLLTVNGRFADRLAQLTEGFTQSQNAVADAQKIVTDIQQTIQQNGMELKSQAQAIADLQKSQHTNKEEFLATEARYLIKLANDTVQYDNNIPVAIKLLQSADQDVSKLTDPNVNSVRQAIASDLVALQAAQQVDVTGIYARLSALDDQLDKLPILNKFASMQVVTPPEKNDETASWWRRGLNTMSDVLQRIVIVRRNQPNIPPFIAPDQQVFLYQNLHAQIEKAQWGLLHRQPEIYRNSLQQTTKWIKQYIVQDSAVTKQVLTDLAQLQEINVHPAVPNVNNSLQAIQSYLNNASK